MSEINYAKQNPHAILPNLSDGSYGQELSIAATYSTQNALYVDDKEQRRLLRKIDLRIMPLVTIFYLCSFLDRINIGNAKIAGLTEDIDMLESDYNIALSIFFVGYIVAELPSSMLLNRLGPKIWISVILVMWGIVMAAMGAVQNGTDLIVARFFLGVAESSLTPSILLYLSVWYTKSELSKRVAIFLASSTLAGVSAYGIVHMDGYQGLHGWQWIFILEAIPPIAMGIVSYIALPGFPEQTTFLTDREREIFRYRMKMDAIAHKTDIEDDSPEQGFSWTPIISALTDWKTYAFGFTCACTLTDVYCIGMFLPSIVRDLGYTNTLVAQLMTVPPNAIASLFSILNSISADHSMQRCLHTVVPSLVAAIGYALLIGLNGQNITAHYIAVTVAVCGASAALPAFTSWFMTSFAGRKKRASAIAIITGIGNIGGIVSGQIYRASDAPRYVHGHTASLVLILFTAIFSFAIRIALRRLNYRREELTVEERHAILTDRSSSRLGDKVTNLSWLENSIYTILTHH
ncbi:major facilitator superfamily domain-containing protein [Fennellomyces sp. T-0311]|nr:major facilitator superfamily domain-containing protein [Fennellomyces sp. T-0311]